MIRAINDVEKNPNNYSWYFWRLRVSMKGIKLLLHLYAAYFQLARGLVFGLVSARSPGEEYTSAVMKYPGTQRLPVAAN